jgi:putative hydrolase of the HAD superfamily
VLRAVTLDATGTLFAPRDLGATYSCVLARHGVELAPAELSRLFGEVWRELACTADPAHDRFARHAEGARGFWRDVVARVCARADAPPPPPFAVAELFEEFARAEAWRLFDEVPGVLAELRARSLALAVVSNWDERLPRLLSRLGVAPSFAAVVYSQEVGVEKPHAAIFAAALERLGVDAGETLHVGDRRLEDVEGATAAGLHALFLVRGGGGDLASLAELPERLAEFA